MKHFSCFQTKISYHEKGWLDKTVMCVCVCMQFAKITDNTGTRYFLKIYALNKRYAKYLARSIA